LQVKVERLESKVEELKCEVERWEQEYDLVNQVVDRKTALGVKYLQEKNEKDREIFRLRGELAEAERNLGLFTSHNNTS
jgi:predicted RNase H-like nuclease (RuvC/YqgF family)